MTPCEHLLVNLVHDLAQPLGNIETAAWCLDRAVDPARAQDYARLIREQAEHAATLLAAATAELARVRAERLDSASDYEMAAVSH